MTAALDVDGRAERSDGDSTGSMFMAECDDSLPPAASVSGVVMSEAQEKLKRHSLKLKRPALKEF